jgi:hypothetical protein
MNRIARNLGSWTWLALASCSATADSVPPPPPAGLGREALLAPFQDERVVVCDTLVIDLSAGFWKDLVFLLNPAVHETQRQAGEPTVYRYTNPGGSAPFRIGLGRLTFVVDRQATLRVHQQAALRLDAGAGGGVIQMAGELREELTGLRIQNGCPEVAR